MFPNGKRYIGYTTKTAESRFYSGHVSATGKTLVQKAIRKYGSGNIQIQTWCIGDLEFIKKLEVLAIAAYKSSDRRYGYNISPGGDTSPALIPEVREKISQTKRLSENVERRSRLITAAHARPDVKERHRVGVTAAHQRPEVKARHIAGVRAGLTPEVIGRITATRKITWENNPELAIAARSRAIDQWENPEIRERNMRALEVAQSTEGARENHRRAANISHADPDFKARHREGCSRGQQRRRARERGEAD